MSVDKICTKKQHEMDDRKETTDKEEDVMMTDGGGGDATEATKEGQTPFPKAPGELTSVALLETVKDEAAAGTDAKVPRKKLKFTPGENPVVKRKRRGAFVGPAKVLGISQAPNLPEELTEAPPSEVKEEPPREEKDEFRVQVVKKKKTRRFCVPALTGPKVTYEPHDALVLAPEVKVPAVVAQYLRPHQRDGVKFLFDCVSGQVQYPDGKIRTGVILADDMGLGKTLQTLSLCYTLLQTPNTDMKIGRIVVVCPCSLVGNWANEFDKWINKRVLTKKEKIDVRAVTEGQRLVTERAIDQFLFPTKPYDVLILSYDALRLNIDRFVRGIPVDVLVADEAQRLKGSKTQLAGALRQFKVAKRILLTGTPLQNDLEEFRALADVANPIGVFGSESEFRKNFIGPITAAREPDASSTTKLRGSQQQKVLADLARRFVLRRENTLNAVHLPPKLVQVLCCRMPDIQAAAYRSIIDDKHLQHALNGKQTDVLVYINKLLKICNHPALTTSEEKDLKKLTETDSAKLFVLVRLMREMRRRRDGERIVIVANATSILDVVAAICDREGWPWCLLDGGTPTKKRKELNESFNDPASNSFAFLLSSTAGGCGLNLIGGNRLVLLDQSWNPATDKQAAARCWRDGNQRKNYVYRLVTTGSIEEKIFQRQLQKNGLANVVEDKDQLAAFKTKDLKQLFLQTDPTSRSDTHDRLNCTSCSKKNNDRVTTTTTTELTPERTMACRRYLLVLQAEAPETFRVALGQRFDALAEKVGTTLGTLPQLRREIDKAVDAIQPKTPHPSGETPASFDAFQAHVDTSWRAFVPKVTAIATTQNEIPVELAPSTTFKPQVGLPAEDDLINWSHHADLSTVDDPVLRAALKGSSLVSFVFGLLVNKDLIHQFQAQPS